MGHRPQGKSVVLLGATGKLGRMLSDTHIRNDLYPLDIMMVSRSPGDNKPALVWTLDHPVPTGLRCDAVLALWGVTGGTAQELDKNTTLAAAALEWARATGANRVIHCSSVAVYPDTPGPFAETDAMTSETPYGQAKAAMERAIAHVTDIRSVILRIGSVAGAESLFASGRRSGKVTLDRFSDGHGPVRSYIGPRDLVTVMSALCHLPLKTVPSVLNVAAPVPVSMQRMAQAMGWEVVWRTAPAGARQSAVLDTTRLQSIVPLGPHASGPEHMARDVRDHWSRE